MTQICVTGPQCVKIFCDIILTYLGLPGCSLRFSHHLSQRSSEQPIEICWEETLNVAQVVPSLEAHCAFIPMGQAAVLWSVENYKHSSRDPNFLATLL
jgi:hypothetical protein